MNPNKALWEKGDFTQIAQSMRESGEVLVEGFGITPALKVLDLGLTSSAGIGARRGAFSAFASACLSSIALPPWRF